jgi:hypothetical protein
MISMERSSKTSTGNFFTLLSNQVAESPESWSIVCPSIPNFGKLGLKLKN